MNIKSLLEDKKTLEQALKTAKGERRTALEELLKAVIQDIADIRRKKDAYPRNVGNSTGKNRQCTTNY